MKSWFPHVRDLALLTAAAACLIAPLAQAAPLEAYGRLPSIDDVKISPDGTRLVLLGVSGDERTILILPTGGKGGGARVGVGKIKLRSVAWADNSHLILVSSQTSFGPMGVNGPEQEYFQAFVYDLNLKTLDILEAKDVQGLNVVTATPVLRLVRGQPTIFFSPMTFRATRGVQSLYAYDLRTKRVTPVDAGDSDLQSYVVDASGVEIAKSLYDDRQWSLKVKLDGSWRSLPPIAAAIDVPSLHGLDAQGQALLVEGTIGGREGWFSVSLKDGAWTTIDSLGNRLLIDSYTGQAMGAVSDTDHVGYRFFDPAMNKIWIAILKAFPGEQVDFASVSDDHTKWAVRVFGQTSGAAYMLVDISTGRADLIGDLYTGVPPDQVAQASVISYPAGDGLNIQAYLTLPKGRAAEGLPLVVLPHGGPEARDELAFDWWAQALASRGYAVLQPQYRGSGGFDANLVKQGYGQWGRKMQTDLSDGVHFLAAQGTIDPKRVCIVGASYGGYAALAGVSLDSGVYRCAVSVSGPSDLKRLMDWEASRTRNKDQVLKYWERYMAAESRRDPSLDQISPIKAAARIAVPVMIIHGKDDTVVPIEQSQLMANALKAAGKPVEMVTLAGEDHWLSRSDTRLKMLQATVRFLEANNPADPVPAGR